MSEWYQDNLAHIHDVGHRDYAQKSIPFIISLLQQHQLYTGLIIDLGCGSGLSAAELIKANYRVLGIDISDSMIAIARSRVPSAEFRVESFLKTNFPPCQAVISVGECLNYRFDSDLHYQKTLMPLFTRIYQSLVPGGVFIFDVAEPGQVAPGEIVKSFSEGEDWLILVEKEEDPCHAILTRRIISLCKTGLYYKREDEIHDLKLYCANDIAEQLQRVGFHVQMRRSYGSFHLPAAHVAFVAQK